MTAHYRFGLVGHNIPYTLSPYIFDLLFSIRGISGEFSVFDIPPDRLAGEMPRLRALDGFSVTIPHKEKIVSLLDHLADKVKTIGAVNSVRVSQGEAYGENTDWQAFLYPLESGGRNYGNVLLLGHGGGARAIIWAIAEKYPGARIVVCGRDGVRTAAFVGSISRAYGKRLDPQAASFEDVHDDDEFDLIINCTPVGGIATSEQSPLSESFYFAGRPSCYDLVYRPPQTKFLKAASAAGCEAINGLPMLVHQAISSYQIWTGDRFDAGEVLPAVLSRLRRLEAAKPDYLPPLIVLCGFSGSGKSSTGKFLADLLGYAFYDTDALMEIKSNREISEIFRMDGEPSFRRLEADIVRDVLTKKSGIVALGGGAIQDEATLAAVKERGHLIYLRVSPETALGRISGSYQRPMIFGQNGQESNGRGMFERIRDLIQAREVWYQQAHAIVDTEDKTPDDVAHQIRETFARNASQG
jgi:shikimate dehydrogenase